MSIHSPIFTQNGKSHATPSNPKIDVLNPVTGDFIDTVPIHTAYDVRQAISKARHAQVKWGELSVRQRGIRLRRWADLVWQHREEIIQTIRAENGKNYPSAYVEIIWIDSVASYYMHEAHRILRPQCRNTVVPLVQRAVVHYKPHGVVGFITPWNYPYALTFVDVIPALIAGNAAIIKPSEITPLTTLKVVEYMAEAGIPKDIFQVVTGEAETGAAVVDQVDYLAFTGSTATGRKVAKRAAERLIPYSLELGGKDPMIVLSDARLDLAASAAVVGATENAGQACVSVERVYVESPVYDEFVQRVVHYVSQMNIGSGNGYDTHMGSLTQQRELDRLQDQISDAVDKGATVLVGGRHRPDIGPLFFEPTVIINVDHRMKVMSEETFGPIIPIMRVTDAEAAIRLANDSEYGLSASIYTRNLKRGRELALQLDTGDVHVNRVQANIATVTIPIGGQKNSGLGRRNGPEGLKRFVSTQSIMVDSMIGSRPALIQLEPLTETIVTIMRRVNRILRR